MSSLTTKFQETVLRGKREVALTKCLAINLIMVQLQLGNIPRKNYKIKISFTYTHLHLQRLQQINCRKKVVNIYAIF